MAQDFGDDVGERLFRAMGRAVGYAFREWLREQEYARRQALPAGQSKSGQDAKTSLPDEICVPFGTSEDASYFAKVCEEANVHVQAFADNDGNGYVQFATDDIERVQDCTKRFAEVMSQLAAERVEESIDTRNPVSASQMKDLSRIEKLPDLPSTGKGQDRDIPLQTSDKDITLIPVAIRFNDEPDSIVMRTFSVEDTEGLDVDSDVFFSGYSHAELETMVGKDVGEDFTVVSVGEPYTVRATKDVEPETVPARGNHTMDIAEKVRDAKERCRSFEDFKDALAKEGIGVTTTKDGEVMFYTARRDNAGNLLPFGRDEAGMRDWAVGADTLKARYGVDATHNWFEQNLPTASDGSLDADGRTPDINQGIESHDGLDTDTRTLRLEREQHGTDVSPSQVREQAAQAQQDDRSLDAVAKECRAASKQLEKESGIAEREIDISDKLSPVR